MTKTTGQHTPLPWILRNHGINEPEYGNGIVHSHGGAHRFAEIQGVGVLETVDMDIPKLEASARLIVTAVNAHEGLVKALENLSSLVRSVREDQVSREMLPESSGGDAERKQAGRFYAQQIAVNAEKIDDALEAVRALLTKAKGGAL